MFGIFGTKKKQFAQTKTEDNVDMNDVKVWYEGEVISGDYNLNNPKEYPFHNLFPHGTGKIVYSLNEIVIEQYEGEFQSGQYHGHGVLIDRHGELHEGSFNSGQYSEGSAS